MTKTWDAAAYDRSFGFVAGHGEAMLEVLAPKPGERILDLGCGTGELTAQIAARGAEVIGLDLDPAMIRRARERHPGLRFEEADAHAFTAGACDAVFSNAALHWMQRPAEVIARVRAALVPGGRFVAEAGGYGNLALTERALHQARADVGAPARPSPWFFPSIGTYAQLLEAGGLEPVWMQLHDRPTPLAAGDAALGDWLNMFGSPLLDDLAAPTRERVLERIARQLRPALFQDGRWSIDYRRLRFLALRRGSGCAAAV